MSAQKWVRRRRGRFYGVGMSADAARAAEILSQLSSPPRLAAYAELVRRGQLVDTGWLQRDRAGSTYGAARPLAARADV
jgi:hypothetical protein